MSDAPGIRVDRGYTTTETQAAAARYMTRTGYADLLPMLGLADEPDPEPPAPKPRPAPKPAKAKPAERKNGPRKQTEAEEAAMVRQYLNGTSSQHSVATDYGVSRETLRQAVVRARNVGAE